MFHQYLVGLSTAAFVALLAPPLGAPAKHILPFLEVPDMANAFFDLQCEGFFKPAYP